MKLLLTILALTSCGPAFTAEETNGQESNPPAASGHSGALASAGTAGFQGSPGGSQGFSGSAGMGNGSSGANTGGNPPMAGGPAVGQGGSGGGVGISQCLANWQNLDCVRPCTNAQACDENGHCQDCQAVLNCFVSTNSIDNCQNFTSLGISLALEAERNCCK